MNNKKIEELINEAKSRNVLAKDPNELREKWLKEALTQVHNSAIEGLLGQPGSPQHFTRHTPDNISSQPMKTKKELQERLIELKEAIERCEEETLYIRHGVCSEEHLELLEELRFISDAILYLFN